MLDPSRILSFYPFYGRVYDNLAVFKGLYERARENLEEMGGIDAPKIYEENHPVRLSRICSHKYLGPPSRKKNTRMFFYDVKYPWHFPPERSKILLHLFSCRALFPRSKTESCHRPHFRKIPLGNFAFVCSSPIARSSLDHVKFTLPALRK